VSAIFTKICYGEIMKKFLVTIILGLILSGNTHAKHTKNIELISSPECGEIEKSVSHVSNTYLFNFKNPSKKKIFIDSLTFLTQEDDKIATDFIFIELLPFHKKSITLDKANIIHKFVNKISLNCDDT